MNCYPEFTYSIYVDGELPPIEAAQIERHLADCSSCRAVVSMMRGENRMIATVLAEAREELNDLPDMSPEIGGCVPARLVFGMMAALAGVILTFRAMLTGVSEWGLSQLGVLEPLSRAVEWLDRFPDLAPKDRLAIEIASAGPRRRMLTVTGHGPRAVALAAAWLDEKGSGR